MTFVARQLLEKTVEHQSQLYSVFVDLKKAYNSIPRLALWRVLEKLGVPPTMLSLIKSLHEGMTAQIRVTSNLTDSIAVCNGLRQGCTLAPTLFNLYFSAVMASWRSQSTSHGVPVKYRIGRKLVGDRTAKSRLDAVYITESQFADDAVLYTISRPCLDQTVCEFVSCASRWGLTVSIQKTKVMAAGANVSTGAVVLSNGASVAMVPEFTYLGSVVSSDGSLDTEITTRLAKASRVFGCLLRPIFQCRNLSLPTKRMVYKAVVLSTLLYGAETWTVLARHVRRLTVFHHACIRTILGVSHAQQWEEHLSSGTLARRFGMPLEMDTLLRQHRLRWLGHVARMDPSRASKQVLFGELSATRPAHGPKKRWRYVIVGDLRELNLGGSWYGHAQDRLA